MADLVVADLPVADLANLAKLANLTEETDVADLTNLADLVDREWGVEQISQKEFKSTLTVEIHFLV